MIQTQIFGTEVHKAKAARYRTFRKRAAFLSGFRKVGGSIFTGFVGTTVAVYERYDFMREVL